MQDTTFSPYAPGASYGKRNEHLMWRGFYRLKNSSTGIIWRIPKRSSGFVCVADQLGRAALALNLVVLP